MLGLLQISSKESRHPCNTIVEDINENYVRVVPDMVRSSLCKRERLADSISGLGLSRACLHHTMGLKAFCRGLFNFASYNLQKHKLEVSHIE